jgi:hypothetical protein
MADPNDTSTQSGISAVLDSLSKEFDTLIGAASEFSDVIKSVPGKEIIDSLRSFATTLPALGVETAAIKAVSIPISALNEALGTVEGLAKGTVETSNEISKVTGLTAASFESLGIASDQALGKFSQNSFDLVNTLADSQTEFIDASGNVIKTSGLLFGGAKEQLGNYSAALLNDTRLYKFAAESLTADNADMVRGITRAQTALRLDARDINLIFQNELSEAGEITGEALSKYETAVAATVKATGLSAEKVSKSMIDVMRDFNTFGDITEARAASLTVTLNNLGLNLSDLTSVVGKFQSFDAATQAMSNFSAITGATLDTLELFRLANEDPEAFVVDLREQLEAQGIQFDELNLIQQRQLSQAFGLDPRVLQRLMNENIESITGASIGLEDKIEETTQADAERLLNSLADSQKKARENVASLLELKTQAAAASLQTAESIGTQSSAIISTNEEMIKSLGGVKDAAIKSQAELRKAISILNQRLIEATGAEPASPVAPTVPASPGTPGTTTAPGAPAVPTPTVPATPPPPQPITVTSTAAVTVKGDGGELAAVLAPMIAVHLAGGVTFNSKQYTFVTEERTA